MAARLHALQGRQNVKCPDCGHSLHLHTDGRCAECADWTYFDGLEAAQEARQQEGFRTACATRDDESKMPPHLRRL